MTSWPRNSRIDGGRSTFSQAVAPARSCGWIRSRMGVLVNRLADALASKSDGSDHFLARSSVHSCAQSLHVGLFRTPLGQMREAALRESVRGVHDRSVPVLG